LQQIFKRICFILKQENIEYDKAVVVELIKKHYPDWRRVINELQMYADSGKIDTGILSNITETNINTLMSYLKEKNFTEARKWVVENIDTDSQTLFRMIYDKANQYVDKNSIPMLVLIISKYQYQAAFVSDHEINVMACLTEMMVDLKFT